MEKKPFELKEWRQWQYYMIIAVLSVIALFFLPMIGTQAGLALVVPTTAIGWVVYIVSKLLVATLNIMIFHCFIQQGRVNIAKDPAYLEAKAILEECLLEKEHAPRSPLQWARSTYGKKGLTIFVTTIISVIGLTQAVLTFDVVSMLTYLFTVIMGIIFGILQMNETEKYWTEEFLDYAKMVQKNKAEEANRRSLEVVEETHPEPQDDTTSDNGGTPILESPDSDGNTSLL